MRKNNLEPAFSNFVETSVDGVTKGTIRIVGRNNKMPFFVGYEIKTSKSPCGTEADSITLVAVTQCGVKESMEIREPSAAAVATLISFQRRVEEMENELSKKTAILSQLQDVTLALIQDDKAILSIVNHCLTGE